MSVVVVLKVKADTAVFEKALVDRADEFVAVGQRAQGQGAIHHRFAVGDGFVLVVDEWEDAAKFEAFFSDPALQQFIGEIGADQSVPPEMTLARAVSTPDEF